MLKRIRRIFERGLGRRGRNARPIPIVLFCYHKTGTVLLERVFKELSAALGWNFQTIFGKAKELPVDIDVAVMAHSLVDDSFFDRPFVGVHVIRDPRDVVVSGYLYHLRTDESWCINEDLSPRSTIVYPQVPHSQVHRSHEWKVEYLARLNGRSYQAILQSLPQEEGIQFEIEHYASWTIEAMLAWNYAHPNVLELQFEQLMSEFDLTFARIFEFVGLSGSELDLAHTIARRHDISRATASEVKRNPHVSDRNTSRWRSYLSDKHLARLNYEFPGAICRLGYGDPDEKA